MKRGKIRYLSLLLAVVLIALLAVGCGGGGTSGSAENTGNTAEETGAGGETESRETITLIIGGGHMMNGMAYTQVAHDFFEAEITKRCAETTRYDIEWTEAYGGTIAKLAEGLQACQDGLLDVLVNSYSFDNNKLYLMNMNYYVPFSSKDPVVVTEASRAVMDAFPDVYEELWSRYNQKFLALGPTGHYELITTFPVSSLDDLRGHKIAAAGANLPWLESTGAVPVQSNLNEAYTSFQTGVYEGWIMWPDATYRYKLHEVAPYYTEIGFGAMAIQGISINMDTWNGLPSEVQAIIEEVAAEYETQSAEAARDWDVTAIETMQGEGLTICEMPQADIERWAAGLPNIPQERADEAVDVGFPGIEIWNAYIDAQEELGHTFARDWVIQ
jgi:TRAP-type C4-dicarboxylate transport system substrate-binding protein